MLLQFFSQLASLQKNYYKKHAVTTPGRAFQGSAIRSLLWNCQQFELPAIPQQRFAPFQSLPQKKCPTATVIVFSQLNKFSTLISFTKTYFSTQLLGDSLKLLSQFSPSGGSRRCFRNSTSFLTLTPFSKTCFATQLLGDSLKLLSQFSPSGRSLTFPPQPNHR